MSDIALALEVSIPKIGFNIMLSLTIKKKDAFKFDGVAEFGNTAQPCSQRIASPLPPKNPAHKP